MSELYLIQMPPKLVASTVIGLPLSSFPPIRYPIVTYGSKSHKFLLSSTEPSTLSLSSLICHVIVDFPPSALSFSVNQYSGFSYTSAQRIIFSSGINELFDDFPHVLLSIMGNKLHVSSPVSESVRQ